MSTNTIGKLVVTLGANSAQLMTELEKTRKHAKGWSDYMAGAAKTSAMAFTAVGLAGAGATVGIVALVNANAGAIDSLAKTADKLGLTTEALQLLRYQNELSGVSIQTTDMALQRMTRRVAEAGQGTGEAKDAIKELGLEADALARMSPDQQFYKIAEAMKAVESQGDRVRLAMKLFDSEGVALVNTLVSDLASAEERFAQLGATITREQAAIVESYNDTRTNLDYMWKAFGEKMTVYLAGPFDQVLEYIEQLAIDMGGLDGVAQTVAAGFIDAFAAIIDTISNVLQAIDEAKLAMRGVDYAWQQQKGNFGAFLDQFGLDYGQELMDAAAANMSQLDEEGRQIVAAMGETQRKAESLRALAERMRNAVTNGINAGGNKDYDAIVNAMAPAATDSIAANSAEFQKLLSQYDKSAKVRLDYEEQVKKINEANITAEEKERLLTAALKERNKALQDLTQSQLGYNAAMSKAGDNKIFNSGSKDVYDGFRRAAERYQNFVDADGANTGAARMALADLENAFKSAAIQGGSRNFDMDTMRAYLEQAKGGENQQLLIDSQDLLADTLTRLNESITALNERMTGAGANLGTLTLRVADGESETEGAVTGDTDFLRRLASAAKQAAARV